MGMSAAGGGQRRGGPMSDINVTPMVDIMLVLLIIFMVTAPLLNQGVEVDLPNAEAKAIQSEKEPLVVSVSANGLVYLENKPLTLDEMGTKIAAMKKSNAKLTVFVQGDRKADYGQVITVMARLQKSGVDQVGLITEPR